ncbi:MAG: non-canonical purine NTP pyrophosphatase [Chloroflexota bacterium]
MDIRFATGNKFKVEALEKWLEKPVQQVNLDLVEIQAIQVRDVIEHKAREAYRIVGKPVIVEDTGLYFAAWNGLPGALIRWYLETVGNDGICQMLTAFDDVSATAESCWGYFDGTTFHEFSGVVAGSISREPRGEHGFGWDPIFIPAGWNKTHAEMTPEESKTISMRRQAILKLRAYLEEQR